MNVMDDTMSGSMRAIVNIGRGLLQLREIPIPEPGPGQVRVRTGACAICPTDLKMIGGWERTGFPAIPGHEWVGTVDAVGPGVDAALAGRPVVGNNVLSDGGEVGFEHAGGYAEYLITDASNLYPIPGDLDPVTATLTEPLAICLRGLSRLNPAARDRTLILGDGTMGLLMLLLLTHIGVSEIAMVGTRPGHLTLAREFGASETIDYHDLDVPLADAVHDRLGTFDAVIETSGAPIAAAASVDVAGHGGRVLVMGDYDAAQASFRWHDLPDRELTLIGTRTSVGIWPEAVALGTGQALPLARLVTHRFPATRFADALMLIRAERDDVIKVVLEW